MSRINYYFLSFETEFSTIFDYFNIYEQLKLLPRGLVCGYAHAIYQHMNTYFSSLFLDILILDNSAFDDTGIAFFFTLIPDLKIMLGVIINWNCFLLYSHTRPENNVRGYLSLTE